jgi:hypothetical protein
MKELNSNSGSMPRNKESCAGIEILNMAKELGKDKDLPLAKTVIIAAEFVNGIKQAKKHNISR